MGWLGRFVFTDTSWLQCPYYIRAPEYPNDPACRRAVARFTRRPVRRLPITAIWWHGPRTRANGSRFAAPLAVPIWPQLRESKLPQDKYVADCRACKRHFSLLLRKVRPRAAVVPRCYTAHAVVPLSILQHHCRRCGNIFCDQCSSRTTKLYISFPVLFVVSVRAGRVSRCDSGRHEYRTAVRVCDDCFARDH